MPTYTDWSAELSQNQSNAIWKAENKATLKSGDWLSSVNLTIHMGLTRVQAKKQYY
jgi:hypothetical protein